MKNRNRHRCPAKFKVFFFILCSIAGNAVAAPVLPSPYREFIEQAVANGAYPNLAVGLIDGKQRSTWTFGEKATKDASAQVAMFEIGATTDVFTSLLLIQATLDGKLHLRDSLREVLPADVIFADPRIGAITLEALATHHSGLPATPENLFPQTTEDPYADYALADLRDFLAHYRPGELHPDYSYSALNTGLLGVALGRAYGDDFSNVLEKKALIPLGLSHSGFADTPALLAGHAYGRTAAHWHFNSLAGAAGLRATLPDLLEFLQINLTPDGSPLRGALLLARHARASGANGEIGVGWNIREIGAGAQTWPLVWRASETGGFSSFIGFRTDQQRAIALLADTTEDLSGLGIAWLSDQPPPTAPPARQPASSAELDLYPGLYRLGSGLDLSVRRQREALSMQLPGQPPWSLQAFDRDVFAANSGTVGVSFIRNFDRIEGLVLRMGAENLTTRRLSARAPVIKRPVFAQSGAALRPYAGDYTLDANTSLRIGARSDSLFLQITGSERVVLTAYMRDHFADADGGYELVFQRDKDESITGVALELAGQTRIATRIKSAISFP